MLIAAATIKDSLPHVQRFVAGNLGGGLDHLVVFLDAPGEPGQDDVRAFLDEHPDVTCVRAGRGWWGSERPRALNERQCTNASVVKHLLGPTAARWVFHVDGDEVVRLDRDVLAAVPDAQPAVQLAPREAVSKLSWDGEPTLFKRELGAAELGVLHERGVLSEPSNRAYFNGHLQGKAGVRPTVPGSFGLHRALDAQGVVIPAHRDERLELFHYESYSGADFVRKWTAMVTSGPPASYRPGRAQHARELRDLIELGLPAEELHDRLVAVYRATTEDDVTALQPLGVLLETDPLAGAHRPQVDADTVQTLRTGLGALRGEPKGGFFNGASGSRPETEDPPTRRRLFGR
ncbi:hypothetical protein BH11ACT8_BH11ACT8_25240 [soil metagenome]